jgi:uncharacterized protein
MNSLFHLAFHVRDLDAACAVFRGVLGCREGRSTATWVDFYFFGQQVSPHLGKLFATTDIGRVGNHLVPMPHFGLVLERPGWRTQAERLRADGKRFVLDPQVRFDGQSGEQ